MPRPRTGAPRPLTFGENGGRSLTRLTHGPCHFAHWVRRLLGTVPGAGRIDFKADAKRRAARQTVWRVHGLCGLRLANRTSEIRLWQQKLLQKAAENDHNEAPWDIGHFGDNLWTTPRTPNRILQWNVVGDVWPRAWEPGLERQFQSPPGPSLVRKAGEVDG
jgi:hypothetical protein